MPSWSAQRPAMPRLSPSESCSGISRPNTWLGPPAGTAGAARTDESIPPLMPTTNPRRFRASPSCWRSAAAIRSVSSAELRCRSFAKLTSVLVLGVGRLGARAGCMQGWRRRTGASAMPRLAAGGAPAQHPTMAATHSGGGTGDAMSSTRACQHRAATLEFGAPPAHETRRDRTGGECHDLLCRAQGPRLPDRRGADRRGPPRSRSRRNLPGRRRRSGRRLLRRGRGRRHRGRHQRIAAPAPGRAYARGIRRDHADHVRRPAGPAAPTARHAEPDRPDARPDDERDCCASAQARTRSGADRLHVGLDRPAEGRHGHACQPARRRGNGDRLPRHHGDRSDREHPAVQLRVRHESGAVRRGKRRRARHRAVAARLAARGAREVTVRAAVPPLWQQLLNVAAFRDELVPSLRVVTNAGGHLPVPVVRALRRAQPHARLFLMYGLTEVLRSTFLPPEEVDCRPDSMGRPIPGAEVLVLRDDLTPCEPGEVGELVHRGSTVTLGYWNDPEETARVFRPHPLRPPGAPDAERVVFSGDLVRRDADGWLYFVGRSQRMIKTLGYRVSPDEIATVLYASGEVAECIITAEPDEARGERIVAHVVLAGGGSLERLRRYAGTELPRHMQPARFDLRESLPRLPSGKHDVAALRDEQPTWT